MKERRKGKKEERKKEGKEDDLGIGKVWIWTEGYMSYLCLNYRPSIINYSKKKLFNYLNCSRSEKQNYKIAAFLKKKNSCVLIKK